MCKYCIAAWRATDDLPTLTGRVRDLIERVQWEERNAWLDDLLVGYAGRCPTEDESWWDVCGQNVFDHRFQWFVIKTAVAAEMFADEKEARLYRSLADRYGKVAEWSMEILAYAFFRPETEMPTPEHIESFWAERQGRSTKTVKQIEAGQGSLL